MLWLKWEATELVDHSKRRFTALLLGGVVVGMGGAAERRNASAPRIAIADRRDSEWLGGGRFETRTCSKHVVK